MKCRSTVFATIVLLSALPALAEVQPSFDPNDVVRQVRGLSPSPHRGEGRGEVSGVSRRASSLQLPPLDDGEFLIDTGIACCTASNYQEEPDIAYDGTNYLVVWKDWRDGEYFRIYAARVSPQGVALDISSIVISPAGYHKGAPAVAFGGGNFFVVWEDVGGCDIYGCRVTPQGAVLDPQGVPVATGTLFETRPDIAFDGTNFLVVYRLGSASGPTDIYGTRVTPQGIRIDPEGIPISTAPGWQEDPTVEYSGMSFLVAWAYGSIYCARVSPDGVVLDTVGVRISHSAARARSPAVAFDRTNLLVVWQDNNRSGQYINNIYGVRIDPQATVLDSVDIEVSLAPDHQEQPAVAFNGITFVVVWKDRRNGLNSDIYAARVTPAGSVLDTGGIAVSTAANNRAFPAVASEGLTSLVAWHDQRGGVYSDVYCARIAQEGSVLDTSGIVVSRAANSQSSPATAFDGANYLTVWTDTRGGASHVYGARVTEAGVVLDRAAIPVSQAADSQRLGAVSFGGTEYIVVWEDYRNGNSSDIYATRVTPNGSVLDSAGIEISCSTGNQQCPSVAFDGANYLVVWQDDCGGTSYDVLAARVASTGVVLDSTAIVVSRGAYKPRPTVVFDGTDYLVAWAGYSSESDLYAARVTPTGSVLDTSGFAVSMAAGFQRFPAIAFDGTNSLVVWVDSRNGTSDIYGARVTSDGRVLDPAGIAISRFDGTEPTVAYDGVGFLVAWEKRAGSYFDIYGAMVGPQGAVIDTGPVVQQELSQHEPALCRGSGRGAILAYTGWTVVEDGKAYNAWRVWGRIGPLVGVEEARTGKQRATSAATVTRGALWLTPASSSKPQASSLLDISGREVMELRSGPNDVRQLAPGVYFVCDKPQAPSFKPQVVRKVVVTR